ncbi:hypothetical protein ACFQ6V_31220, partial [Streptomyces roseifaciens]
MAKKTPVFAGPKTYLERRYGDPDTKQAAEYGYWLPGADQEASQGPEPSRNETALTFGDVAAFRGKAVPEGGCLAEVTHTLAGDTTTTVAEYGEVLIAGGKLSMA